MSIGDAGTPASAGLSAAMLPVIQPAGIQAASELAGGRAGQRGNHADDASVATSDGTRCPRTSRSCGRPIRLAAMA